MQKIRRRWNYTFQVRDALVATAAVAVLFAMYRISPWAAIALGIVLGPTFGHYRLVVLVDAERRRCGKSMKQRFDQMMASFGFIAARLGVGYFAGAFLFIVFVTVLDPLLSIGPMSRASYFFHYLMFVALGVAMTAAALHSEWPKHEARAANGRQLHRRKLYAAARQRWLIASLAGLMTGCLFGLVQVWSTLGARA